MSSQSEEEMAAATPSLKRPATDTYVPSRKKVPKLRNRFFRPGQDSAFSDEYLELYNETVLDVANDPVSELPSSQIGMTEWSGEEKAVVLAKLLRSAQFGIESNWDGVNSSKSVVETADYLHALQKASSTERENGVGPLLYIQVPAAAEVSEECCNVLDTEADSLIKYQGRHEERRAYKKYGKAGILTQEVAQEIEERFDEEDHLLPRASGNDGSGMKIDEHLSSALELLCLPTWLELSARVFMNYGGDSREHFSWHEIDEGKEQPAIFASTFGDFYNLAVSFTKRVCCAAIFQAESRRRMDIKDYRRKVVRSVKRHDVLTALDILGAKRNAFDFWVQVPRRCNLDVVRRLRDRRIKRQTRKRKCEDADPLLSLNKVEKILSHSRRMKHDALKSLIAETEEMVDATMSDGPDKVLHTPPLTSLPNEEEKQDLDDANADSYLEALDMRNSQRDENRIWTLLDRTEKYRPEQFLSPKPPNKLLRVKNDMKDWRNTAEPSSEWEMFGQFLTHEREPGNLELGRRRKQRMSRSTALEDSNEDSAFESTSSTSSSDDNADSSSSASSSEDESMPDADDSETLTSSSEASE